MKQKPDLSFRKLWDLSFGFFGVQIAYALQSANIARIFATLGADPHSLSYFWILPPLMGILVQPIVGSCSDRTWTRFGRRIPYLFVGAAVAVLVMCLLPNAGSFGMAVSAAMVFGLVTLMFLDTSINMAMQPFKMLVGDMVNEKQKALAYSIQSFLCNAGSLVGYVFPFFCWFAFMYMWTYTNGTVAANCWGVDMFSADATATSGYQEAGNWVGMLFAVQAIGSVIWAMVLPQIRRRKLAYSLSLLLGGVGFVMAAFVMDKYLMFVPFLLIGCAWAAMLAMPFTFVTNALQGYGHMGAYLGLFNGTICVPQIIAAALGGVILALVGSVQAHMMIVAGVALVIGALVVGWIKDA